MCVYVKVGFNDSAAASLLRLDTAAQQNSCCCVIKAQRTRKIYNYSAFTAVASADSTSLQMNEGVCLKHR